MDKKIIDLEIIEELEGSGVDAIALVDEPAIEKYWVYMRSESFVKPSSGETQDEFINRCIPAMIDEGKPQDQAVAMCYSMWEQDKMSSQKRLLKMMSEVGFRYDFANASLIDGFTNEEQLREWVNTAATKGRTVYKYDGGTPQRDFCREMMSLDKFYTFEEIQAAESIRVNKGFGEKGGPTYSIWKYHGGPNCKHYFRKYYVFIDEDDRLRIEDKGRAVGIAGQSTYDQPNHGYVNRRFSAEDFADYPWDECVSDMKDRGLPQANAERLCGWIRANMEVDTSSLPPYTEQVKSPLKKKPVAMAAVEDLKVGDAVSWKTADQNPRGRITEIAYRRKKVPGVDFYIDGSETDPGYIIEIYERSEGKWQGTGKYVGRKADSILKNVELWRSVFASEEEKILVGPVAIPNIEIVRKGKDGNPYFVRFSEEAVAKMAEKFMRELRAQNTNVHHDSESPAGTYIFESWMVEDAETDKANTIYNMKVPKGSWMVKARVTDDKVWKMVKAGKVQGFSLEGNFVSQEEYEAYIKDKKMYEDLVSLLNSWND